jgi:hypothetical protein
MLTEASHWVVLCWCVLSWPLRPSDPMTAVIKTVLGKWSWPPTSVLLIFATLIENNCFLEPNSSIYHFSPMLTLYISHIVKIYKGQSHQICRVHFCTLLPRRRPREEQLMILLFRVSYYFVFKLPCITRVVWKSFRYEHCLLAILCI